MNLLIYGAGQYGKILHTYFEKNNQSIVGFIDKNYDVLKSVCGINVYPPSCVKSINYDKIIISMGLIDYVQEAKEVLLGLGVDESKIKVFINDEELFYKATISYNLYTEDDKRVNWLKSFASFTYERDIKGAVAECGVYKGEFAYYINKYFPDRKLYLFDTFGGFDERDLLVEKTIGDGRFDSNFFNETTFHATSEKIVLGRMLHKKNCIIKKGYFPETGETVDDTFCFVNLDMDLYQPMFEGLKFFYNKMSKGGIILLHDYFHSGLPGVKVAVEDFEKEIGEKLSLFPIGDSVSIAIIK